MKPPAGAKSTSPQPDTQRPGMAEEQAAAPAESSVPAGPSRPAPPPKPLGNKGSDFKAGDYVVYPTHGVGQVQGIETMSAAGHDLKVIVVTFEENRMTLRVPLGKAATAGLRMLANKGMIGRRDKLYE